MGPFVSTMRMNPFAAGILRLAVQDVLERSGCREYAFHPETGTVDALVTVEGRESRFLFMLSNPFMEVAVTDPHPQLSREEACRAVDALADSVMAFMADEERVTALLAQGRKRWKEGGI